jgi:hypothetical protein
MTPYPFHPLKHNPVVATLAPLMLRWRTHRLEKLIFTATTGRSGTLSLANLFAAVPQCASVHEAHPIMHGSILRAASYGDARLVDRVYRQVKSVNILRAALGCRYYFEANHLFVKTFLPHAIEQFGDRLRVIHLVRPAIEVATSIYCLRDHPGTQRGNYWWLDYRAPVNLIRIADLLDSDPEFSHPFYKALWYWYEIEARIAAWRARLPMLRVVRFETAWLNEIGRVRELFDGLGIEYDDARLEGRLGERTHIKAHQKYVAALDPTHALAMDERFQALLADHPPRHAATDTGC